MNKKTPTTYFAAMALLALSVWMLSGYTTDSKTVDDASSQIVQKKTVPMKVRVEDYVAQLVTQEVVVHGQLEPKRVLSIRVQTSGPINTLPVQKGSRVLQGDTLLMIALEDRELQLKEAEAKLLQRKQNLKAMNTLKIKGLSTETQMVELKALLATAQAELAYIKRDIENTKILAPFSGIVNNLDVEKGSFVVSGDTVATLVDDSTLIVSGNVPQQSVAMVKVGQSANVELISGEIVEGKVIYVSALSNTETRSYRVEVEIPNFEQRLVAGVSAVLNIPVNSIAAHYISPAILALNDKGLLGVKAVNAANQVVFYPVEIVRTQSDGVWISGAPKQVRLITLGQGFVSPDDLVDPVQTDVAS